MRRRKKRRRRSKGFFEERGSEGVFEKALRRWRDMNYVSSNVMEWTLVISLD
jgi:hypothetical protein